MVGGSGPQQVGLVVNGGQVWGFQNQDEPLSMNGVITHDALGSHQYQSGLVSDELRSKEVGGVCEDFYFQP